MLDRNDCVERMASLTAVTPAVVLVEPKHPENVAGALRACAAFDIPRLYVTGERVKPEPSRKPAGRIRREFRLTEYQEATELVWCDFPIHPKKTRIVAVEILPGSVPLTYFELKSDGSIMHPEECVYVFGPEDGTLGKAIRTLCTDFVIVPSQYCLNLACAVNIILWDRTFKRQLAGQSQLMRIDGKRGLD